MADKLSYTRLQRIVLHCLEGEHKLKIHTDFTVTFDQKAPGEYTVTAKFSDKVRVPKIYRDALSDLSKRYNFTFADTPRTRQLQEA